MENGEPKHIWTLLSLKEYFERILLEHKWAYALSILTAILSIIALVHEFTK